MKCWAITGPMGAGKSSFSGALVRLGASLIDADYLGHQVLQDPEVIAVLVGHFGSTILKDGQVNRPVLGRIVFDDPTALETLNSITHPPICDLGRKKVMALAREKKHPLAVFEAAVYFLFPEPPECDLVITVTAPENLRIQRLLGKRGLSLAETKMRMKSQDFLKKHWVTADVVLHNDGTPEELEIEARKLMIAHRLIAGDEGPGRELSP